MKYPDDFTRERNGYARGSQGDRDALARVDAPYLTKESRRSRTYKKNGFYENEVFVGEPSLVGVSSDPPPSVLKYSLADIEEDESFTEQIKDENYYRTGAFYTTIMRTRMPYVGDNFVMTALATSNDGSVVADADWTIWPCIHRVPVAGRQYLSSDPLRMGRSTTWIDAVQFTGIFFPFSGTSLVCSGWDNSTKRYRFGVSSLVPEDQPTYSPGEPVNPVFFAGDTGTQTMQQVGFPYWAGRITGIFTPYVIAPGRLQALVRTVEGIIDTTDPAYNPSVDLQRPPFLANSVDHGTTWTAASASFLSPFLYQVPASGDDREHYSLPQHGSFSDNVIIGMGEGKSLLIITAGLKDFNGLIAFIPGDPGPAPNFARLCPMAFLGTNGAGYTRIPWPPDDWLVYSLGDPYTTSYLQFFGSSGVYGKDRRNCQFAFGVGCVYLPVRHEGANNKIMFTRDFGASWTISPALPGLMNTNYFTSFGTIIKPYVDANDKGQIVFAQPEAATGKIKFLSTDGDFTVFKTVGVVKPFNELDVDTNLVGQIFNIFFTNFGGENKPYVFPAFPGEYDEP